MNANIRRGGGGGGKEEFVLLSTRINILLGNSIKTMNAVNIDTSTNSLYEMHNILHKMYILGRIPDLRYTCACTKYMVT